MRQTQWQLQTAKAQFSELVEAALRGEPQRITRRGKDAVMLVSEKSFLALKQSAKSDSVDLVAHLLAMPREGAQKIAQIVASKRQAFRRARHIAPARPRIVSATAFLLDTVVLSELRKNKPAPHVLRWMRAQQSSQIFISVVSIGEIERGIENARKSDAVFAADLARWLETLLTVYGEHILPVSTPIARRWGTLSAKLGNDGADTLIAATALAHGLTVVTRNVKHFVPTGAAVFDPFER